MLELICFTLALAALIAHPVFLGLWLKLPARRWALSTVILVVAFALLPPHWFSSVIVVAAAFGSCLSHLWVLRRLNRSSLPVGKQMGMPEPDKGGEISPFPVMTNEKPAESDPDRDALAQDNDYAEYDRAKHPTKRPSSKRARSKKGRKKGKQGGAAPASTADIPTADKPTIEEYLKPRDNFFND